MQAVPIVLAYDFVCPWCWILDAQATAAGLAAGLTLAYEKVARTPNTRRAHRLLQFAMLHGNAENMARLFDAIFAAYFSQRRDIGSVDTLVEIAGEQGFDSRAAYAYLLSDACNHEVNSARLWAQRSAISNVPTVLISNTISGAQPPAVFAQALHDAATEARSTA